MCTALLRPLNNNIKKKKRTTNFAPDVPRTVHSAMRRDYAGVAEARELRVPYKFNGQDETTRNNRSRPKRRPTPFARTNRVAHAPRRLSDAGVRCGAVCPWGSVESSSSSTAGAHLPPRVYAHARTTVRAE